MTDTSENENTGISIVLMAGAVTAHTIGEWGGLEGTTVQTQGQIVKSAKTDDNGNLKINGKVIDKTSSVVIVPDGTYGYVSIAQNAEYIVSPARLSRSNETYCTGKDGKIFKGLLYTYTRLSPFVMSKYEVTQELYNAVMG